MKNKQTQKWIRWAAGPMAAVLLLCSTVLAAPPADSAPSASAAPAVVDLTIEDAVRMTLATNPAGKMAVSDYEAAKGALTSARSYRWPTVSLTHTDSWTQPAQVADFNNPTITKYSNYANANWTIWSGNRIESQISQYKLDLDSANWGVALSRQQLKFNAVDGYLKLMAARDYLEYSKESVARLEQYLRDVRLQFEVGTVAKVDVLRSEVELAKAQQTLIVAQNAYDIAMATLNNIVGLPLGTILKVKDEMPQDKVETQLPTAIDTALRQRPEILQTTDAAKKANEGVTVAKAGYLPTIAASYQAGYYDSVFNTSGSANYNWTLYLQTSWTIMDSGLTAGKVKTAVELFRKAKELLRKTVDDVQLEVRSTYLSLRAAEKSIDTNKAAVGLAEEDYKIKVIRYQAGVGTNLDVIDAQVALVQAKNNYLSSLYEFNNNRAKLNKAMGMPVN